MIIGDYGQLVRGNIISAPYNEISKVPSSHIGLLSQMLVREDDSFAIRNAKAPIHSGRFFEITRICPGAALTRIDWLVIAIVRRSG